VTRFALRLLASTLMIVSASSLVRAHDPSTYGGLFRSHNFGETWLNADAGLFVNAALTVAVNPRDPTHLLMGTDTGLLRSQNGGRSWTQEAQGLIFGAVFAIAFSRDGQTTICAAPSGVFRFHDGQWTRAAAPDGAAPARAIALAAEPDRVYLLGPGGLFSSDDGGRSFRRGPGSAGEDGGMTALAVASGPGELLLAVINGKLMASRDGGRQWARRAIGSGGGAVDTVVADEASPSRLWAAAADQIYVSDDLGTSWRPTGTTLPEPGTNVRGIAANAAASTVVVTTHRGLYRSLDGGTTWTLKEGALPIHLEAGPLVRDPSDAPTLYAVYSLLPYAEAWHTALQGGSLLARVDPLSLAGGIASLLLLILGGGLLVVWLERARSARHAPRSPVP
jgi:photosystem II stability/assembly factor-like uncharacterized protein